MRVSVSADIDNDDDDDVERRRHHPSTLSLQDAPCHLSHHVATPVCDLESDREAGT